MSRNDDESTAEPTDGGSGKAVERPAEADVVVSESVEARPVAAGANESTTVEGVRRTTSRSNAGKFKSKRFQAGSRK